RQCQSRVPPGVECRPRGPRRPAGTRSVWPLSTPGSPNPTLVDWLRAQDDETLATLLRLRPDLGVPPPADLVVLATRAGVRASVHRACDDLDSVTLAVLEAAVVADADTAPVPA